MGVSCFLSLYFSLASFSLLCSLPLHDCSEPLPARTGGGGWRLFQHQVIWHFEWSSELQSCTMSHPMPRIFSPQLSPRSWEANGWVHAWPGGCITLYNLIATLFHDLPPALIFPLPLSTGLCLWARCSAFRVPMGSRSVALSFPQDRGSLSLCCYRCLNGT